MGRSKLTGAVAWQCAVMSVDKTVRNFYAATRVVVSSKLESIAAFAMVAVLASLNFIVGIGEPSHPIWDESYYLTTMQRYREGTAQFASHPPLGLMLIAAGDSLVWRGPAGPPERDLPPGNVLAANKSVSGDQLPMNYSFVGPRIASGVFAVLGALAFFALMWRLTGEIVSGLLFSNLYLFENAFIVHFRAAQLDAFQITFLICALLAFVLGMRARPGYSSPSSRRALWIDFALGVVVGCATMVKVSAVLFALLGPLLIAYRVSSARAQVSTAIIAAAARDAALMFAGFLLIVATVFTLHVAVSPHPPNAKTPAGQKDLRFVSLTYLDYLEGRRSLSPRVVLAAASDYSRFIAADQTGVAKTDANGSHPFQWPFNYKTINYRWDSDGTRTAYSQLVGNPMGWPAALLSVLVAVAFVFKSRRRAVMSSLLILYAAVMVAHFYLDSHRVLYLYHYFPALLIAFCLCPLALQEFVSRFPPFQSRERPTLYAFSIVLLASFLFLAPLSFHRPLTRAECERRNFPQHIVDCQPTRR